MMKKWLSSIAALVLLIGCITPVHVQAETADPDWYTSGGTNNAWYIYDAADMLAFAETVSSGTDTFTGKTVYLANSIDLSAVGTFPMIGNKSTAGQYFTGTFDGQNHTISGLSMDAHAQYAGLFSMISGATLRNFTLESPSITQGAYQRAGLVTGATANATNNTISNVTVTGGTITTASGWAGGLVGGSMGTLTITNCRVEADFESTGTVTGLGGLVGYQASNGVLTISNSSVTGSIVTTGPGAGGIIGDHRSTGSLTITNCTVSADVAGKQYCGGMLGYKEGNSFLTITDCLYTGTVTATANPSRCSGIAGYLKTTKDVNISYCTVTGAVGASGNNLGGGILGQCDSAVAVAITGCAVTATITGSLTGSYLGNGNGASFTIDRCYRANYGTRGVCGNGTAPTITALANDSFDGETIGIANVNRLLALSYLSKETTYAGATLDLTADLDLSGIGNFPMIGASNKAFQGTFDGNGHKISNMTVNGGPHVGFIARADGSLSGGVSNLTIEDAAVTGTHGSNAYGFGGILVGTVENGTFTVEDVTVTDGTITAVETDAIGGLIGTVHDAAVTVTGCTVEATVSAQKMVGGLLGYAYGTSTVEIQDSEITAAVTASDNSAGGIVGQTNGTATEITNCRYAGTVTSTKEGDGAAGRAYLGGFVGYLSTTGASLTATDSLMTGTITKSGNAFIGGVVGSGNQTSPVTLTRVLVTGSVTADNGCVGAVLGNNTTFTGTITDSYALDTVAPGSNNRGGLGAAVAEGKISDMATILSIQELTGVAARINASGLDYQNYWVAVNGGAPELKSFQTGTAADVSDVYDVAPYRTSDYTAPTKSGKVFAGWYLDTAFTTALDEAVTTGYAIAKWVDAGTLNVCFQFKATDSLANDHITMRVLTTVDCKDYQNVKFRFGIGGNNYDFTTMRTYETVTGDGVTYTPTSKRPNEEYYWSADSAFICGYNIDVKSTLYDTAMTITACWTTSDGTTVYGASRNITVRNDFTP